MLCHSAGLGLLGYYSHHRVAKLTHPYFAGDLFVFCNNFVHYLDTIKYILSTFYDMSGLRLATFEMFNIGLLEGQEALLLARYGLKRGVLPIKS